MKVDKHDLSEQPRVECLLKYQAFSRQHSKYFHVFVSGQQSGNAQPHLYPSCNLLFQYCQAASIFYNFWK